MPFTQQQEKLLHARGILHRHCEWHISIQAQKKQGFTKHGHDSVAMYKHLIKHGRTEFR